MVTSRLIFRMGIASQADGLYYLGHTVSNPDKIIVSKHPDFFEFIDDDTYENESSTKDDEEKTDETSQEKENEEKKDDSPKDKKNVGKSRNHSKKKEISDEKRSEDKNSEGYLADTDPSLEERKKLMKTQLENTDLESKLESIRKNYKDRKFFFKYTPDYMNRIDQLRTNFLSNETRNLLNGKNTMKLLSVANEFRINGAIGDIASKVAVKLQKTKGEKESKDTSDKINDLDKNSNTKNQEELIRLNNEFPILEDASQISRKMQFSLIPKDQYFKLMNDNGKCLARDDLDLYFTTCDKAVLIEISSGIGKKLQTPQIRKIYRNGMNKTKNELMEDLVLNDVMGDQLRERRGKITAREKQITEGRRNSEEADPILKNVSSKNLKELAMVLDQEISLNERRTLGLHARRALVDKIADAETNESK